MGFQAIRNSQNYIVKVSPKKDTYKYKQDSYYETKYNIRGHNMHIAFL